MLSHILSFMPYNQPTIAEGGLWVKEVINRELIVGFDRPASHAKFVARLEIKPDGVP